MDSINPYETPQLGELIDERRSPAIAVTLVDMLRVSIGLYVGHLLPIAAVMLLFWLPMELAAAYLNYFEFDSDDTARSYQLTLLFQHVIGLIPEGSIMAICLAVFQGRQPTMHAALAEGFAAWPRMFATRLSVIASVLLAMVLFIIPGIYVGVRTLLAEPAALAEHHGGLRAPSRSFELTQGRFWQMCGVFFILLGYGFGIGIVSQVPFLFFDHWLLTAGISILIDVLSGWVTVLIFTAYWSLAHQSEPVLHGVVQ